MKIRELRDAVRIKYSRLLRKIKEFTLPVREMTEGYQSKELDHQGLQPLKVRFPNKY